MVGDAVAGANAIGDGTLVFEIERLLSVGIGITAIALDQTPDAEELTLAQWRALVVAAANEGVRIGELATRLGLSVPAASRLVRRVERRGFVSTARAEDDRRATNVTLTAAGRRTVDAVVGRRRRLIGLALERSQGGPSERAVGLLHELAGQLGDYG
jgi:DNA-binding MarR family transcriptional regulator